MNDPRVFCQKCNRPWKPADESCPNCNFDPTDDEADAKAYYDAIQKFEEERE
jgi:predicted amidophosphoribosyltransferase